MSGTGATWVGLQPGQILGLTSLRERWRDPTREAVRLQAVDTWDQGGVLGSYATFTYAGGRLTLDAARTAYTPDGYRVLPDPAWPGFTDVPYQDSGATVYTLGACWNDVPVEVAEGTLGAPLFSAYQERIGRLLTPDSVTDTGAGVRLTLTTALHPGERWSNVAHTRPVRAWFTRSDGTPATADTEALVAGTLTYDGAAYVLEVPHYFGQDVLDTDPARYTVLLEGLTVAEPAAAAASAFVDTHVNLGTVTAGVHSSASQLLIDRLGTLWNRFGAEHDRATGVHTDVTALSVTVPSVIGDPDLDLLGQEVRMRSNTAGLALVLATLAGSGCAVRAEDGADSAGMEVDRDTGNVSVASTYGDVMLAASGGRLYAGTALETDEGVIGRQDTSTGLVYRYDPASGEPCTIDVAGGWVPGEWDPSSGDWIDADQTGSRAGVRSRHATTGTGSMNVTAQVNLGPFNTAAPDTVLRLDSVTFNYLSGLATLTLEVLQVHKSTGAQTVLATLTQAPGNSGPTTVSAAPLPIFLDPSTYVYVVEARGGGVPVGGSTQTGWTVRAVTLNCTAFAVM